MPSDRRSVLKKAALCSVALSSWNQIVSHALADEQVLKKFNHGVASGDPTADSTVLWTRVSTTQAVTPVQWELAEDARFKHILQKGQLFANADNDWRIKVIATGLKPGRQYFYRFHCDGITSEPGRTKTLPVGDLSQLGIAVASCSNYPFGFFNAYEAIANDQDIDFVIHLGDYIYEYGTDGWGADEGRKLGRNHKPAHEIISLQDYRTRHGQYKADVQSRLMHASHPLIAIWDDHESANNPYINGAQNHQPNEGPWQQRREASLQAYYEWMPIRDPQNANDRAAFWRAFDFGNLVSLTTLETRHTGRNQQINYAEHLDLIKTDADLQHFKTNILGDPNREMLSKDMQNFLKQHLITSKKNKQRWHVIGNQIPMAETLVPLVPKVDAQNETSEDPVTAERKQFKRLGELGLPMYLDTWDGYPAARERFYQMSRDAGIENLIVLTGDSHSFWLNNLKDTEGNAMGIEIGTAGISSPGDFEEFGPDIAELMDQLLVKRNDQILWTDGLHRGYVRVVFTPEKVKADFVAVNTEKQPVFTSFAIKKIQIRKNGQLLTVEDRQV